MNLRDLKYIIAVAETRHFGKAARRCYVSQPTLSGQIKKLEDELGVAIFERTNRSVQVTPVGAEILQLANTIIEQADAITQLAQAQRDPLAGPLRVGAIPTLSPYLMPLILQPLQRQHPQMRLILSEEHTDTLLERLLLHQIDAAFLATPVVESELLSLPLFDEPFWVAYPRKHAFYARDKITRRDVSQQTLLLLSEGNCLADQAMDLCDLQQRQQQGDMADLRAASLETLIQLVGAGFGITLVPALAMRGSWTSGSGVVAQPLNWPHASRRVILASRHSFPRHAAIQALADIVITNLPNTVHSIRGPRKRRQR